MLPERAITGAGALVGSTGTAGALLAATGVAAGAETFNRFLAVAGWEPEDIDRTFCHQVGVAHRKLMFESLGLDPKIDFATLETLGNTGAAALPVTMALGVEQCVLNRGDRQRVRHRPDR